jgi:hypothetical protein
LNYHTSFTKLLLALLPPLPLLLLLLGLRVRELCIQRGLLWAGSLAKSACSEQDYYEQLVTTYQAWARVRI